MSRESDPLLDALNKAFPAEEKPPEEDEKENANIDELLKSLQDSLNGKIEKVSILPDESGFAVVSMPLPKDHWLYTFQTQKPPMLMRLGMNHPRRLELTAAAQHAAMYAICVSTDNGREADFDPDAMVQNFLTGLFGYYTENGLSEDDMFNPDFIPEIFE